MTKSREPAKALIHSLYENPMSGREIEERSFALIDAEAPRGDFAPEEWAVVKRMIHTTADFELSAQVKFSRDAIATGIAALRRCAPLYVDANMIRSGLSLPRLREVCPEYEPEKIVCHVADPDVSRQAQEQGLPRSLFAVRKAASILHGGIAVFGNAPVALLELNRMVMEEGIRPALVVAMPVGFVHVIESKEELTALDLPFIAIGGRRGGSPLAVATIHALCGLALERPVPSRGA
jgi:precorrin-8X/cobalt-precorrin-8 methylmutase